MRRLFEPVRYGITRGGSRTAATSKVELFVIIVNGCKPLTIIAKSSTLDIAAVLDRPPLTAKVTFKQKVKIKDYWTFQIYFVFSLALFLELETREG